MKCIIHIKESNTLHKDKYSRITIVLLG
uniref:Uncharacterized protein n=1 Tax=Anguilla anguilla TaxID=7936 RepID=A0A0E9RTG9_ANGAN